MNHDKIYISLPPSHPPSRFRAPCYCLDCFFPSLTLHVPSLKKSIKNEIKLKITLKTTKLNAT